jgi:uncharacterized protein (DUF58 family)
MRPWQLLLLILLLAYCAISSGWKVLYILAYVLLILFVLAWCWARFSLRKIVFHRPSGSYRVQVGEVFEESLMLDNVSIFPKLWVQVIDGSTLPGYRAGYVTSIGGRKRAIWRARCTCRQRGRFQLGPVSVLSGDPFGFFRRRFVLAPMQEILVMPSVLPLTQFSLFTGGLPGRGRGSQRALQTTTNATTVREYVTGDAMNRIHWRSSAHHNKLMVKEFDLDPAVNVWIFLDLQESVQAGEDEKSTEEYGVTIAATVAHYLLRQDLSVGLIVNGKQREMLSLDRGDRQIGRVLELLAVVRAGNGPSLHEALALEALQFGRNAAVIVITPSDLHEWHESVEQLQRRGVGVSVIGLNAASFEHSSKHSSPDEDPWALLEGAGISVLRIKCHDSLPQLLEGGGRHPFGWREGKNMSNPTR